MNKKRCWGPKGQPKRMREDRGGRILTLLTAISVFGVELFMIIQGSVNTLIWSYFITEIQK